MSYNYIKTNVVYSTVNDDQVRVETYDGKFFDIDKVVFEFIDFFSSQIHSEDEFEKLSGKNKKILDSLIEKRILLKEGSGVEKNLNIEKRIVLFKVESIKVFSKVFGFLFFRPLLCFLIFIALFTSDVFYIVSIKNFNTSDLANITSPLNILIIIVLLFLSNIFHEFGHALACIKYTGRCKEVGLKFNYIFPVFYCDVSPILMLTNKVERAMVGFAGVYFQMFFTASLALLIDHPAVLLFQIISLGLIILNLYPFGKTDGYWILCDLMGYKNFFNGTIKAFQSKSLGYKDVLFILFYICTLLILLMLILDGFNYVTALIVHFEADWVNIYRSVLFLVQLMFLCMLIYEFYDSFRAISNSKIKL
ncbi:MAG: hypothetical protein HRT43_05210, partial [Campylobacteraceae bacterium]|nr:hypothetical protein [Campylobacteraceae bacterium]